MTVTPPPERNGTISTRQLRIAALAGGAVLIVGLAIAVGTAGGGKPAPSPSPSPSRTSGAAAVPPATNPPQVPPPAASTPPPTGGASPTPTTPVVRWHGPVTVSGPDADRDLDSVPPRTYPQDADLTGHWLETTIKAVGSGVQIAVTTGTPGYRQCRDTAAANGADHTERLGAGDVLCVITSQGRIARLITKDATQTSSDPIIKFDVTVWDPPMPH
ncbi:hypothetical protein NE236_42950 [Actinoallomurus purpureus]|uniref:hypothetical protein n=1 Tax=Actinoallomurus purpureus TaxID=478114 RepID=UPI0020926597|nr:hypothetical protein [Actinoallomurus purpureus]MCO6011726.1 hypothetical protein [Actinoallomurus purpureus]